MKKVRSLVILALCFLCACSNKQEKVAESVLNENGKEEIQLCMTVANITLQEMIVEYNKQSERYEIVLTEFDDSMSVEDHRNRVQLELSSGNGPDILAYTVLQGDDIIPYVEEEMFLDVTDFLMRQGNICKSVADYNRVGDRLYGVPISFDLNMMVTSQSVATDREKWTSEYSMQAMKENGADVFCGAPYGWTKEEAGIYVLNLLGVGMDGIQLFVDEEKGVSSFEQQEFIELLEFSKKHADPNPMNSGSGQIASGEQIYTTGSIGSFRDFWYFSELFGGEPSYIGYPSPEGGQYKLIIDNFYINASSSHKEGAMDFLQYLLSEEQQRKIVEQSVGFSVNQDLLKALWAEAKQDILDGRVVEKGGLKVKPRLMTEEEENIFWEMLENPVYYEWSNDIYDIVWEEVLPYYYGKKSAEEVAKTLDNRVQLYLDERK